MYIVKLITFVIVLWLPDDNTEKCTPPVAPLTAASGLVTADTPRKNASSASEQPSPAGMSEQYDLQSAVTNGGASEKAVPQNESQDGSETEHSYEPVSIRAQVCRWSSWQCLLIVGQQPRLVLIVFSVPRLLVFTLIPNLTITTTTGLLCCEH